MSRILLYRSKTVDAQRNWDHYQKRPIQVEIERVEIERVVTRPFNLEYTTYYRLPLLFEWFKICTLLLRITKQSANTIQIQNARCIKGRVTTLHNWCLFIGFRSNPCSFANLTITFSLKYKIGKKVYKSKGCRLNNACFNLNMVFKETARYKQIW